MAELTPAVAATPHAVPLRGASYLCERCSACCRWPGEVVLEDGELETIADFLGLRPEQFADTHTTLRTNRRGLTIAMREDGACSMLEEAPAPGKPASCRINPVKPRQCAGFPNAWRFAGWHKWCEATLVTHPDQKEPT